MKFTYRPNINEVSKYRTFSENCFDRLYKYKDVIKEKKEILVKKYTPKFMPNVDKSGISMLKYHEPSNYRNFKINSINKQISENFKKSNINDNSISEKTRNFFKSEGKNNKKISFNQSLN